VNVCFGQDGVGSRVSRSSLRSSRYVNTFLLACRPSDVLVQLRPPPRPSSAFESQSQLSAGLSERSPPHDGSVWTATAGERSAKV
jgi:hypothetical protein